MSSGESVLRVPSFFFSDLPIRPRSKIPRRALPQLCLVFCWPKHVDEAARITGFSVPTVKDLYFSIRELLLDPRYRKWHPFARQSPFLLDPWMLDRLRQRVLSRYADCYFNQECQRNFLYGKRKERECRICPVLRDPFVAEHIDRDHHSQWLGLVDLTRDFYLNTLGIRREGGFRGDIFIRRAYHATIITAARFHCKGRQKKGVVVVDPLKPGFCTVLDLCETLLHHIAEGAGLGTFPIVSWKGQTLAGFRPTPDGSVPYLG